MKLGDRMLLINLLETEKVRTWNGYGKRLAVILGLVALVIVSRSI